MLSETLEVAIRRSDRRASQEVLLTLAGAHAGLGHDELAVRLDTLRQAMMAEAFFAYPQALLEPLEKPIHEARDRLDPNRVREIEAEVRLATLESAAALLAGQTTSMASPKE